MRYLTAAALTAAMALVPAVTLAQEFDNQIAARKGEMRVLALNLGVLGGMARGNMPYDAEMAQVAADNIVAVSTIDQRFSWPEGSDNGMNSNTLALPAIWEDRAKFDANWDALGEAAVALQQVAGDGLEGLGAGLGGVGRTCGTCHESFQQSDN